MRIRTDLLRRELSHRGFFLPGQLDLRIQEDEGEKNERDGQGQEKGETSVKMASKAMWEVDPETRSKVRSFIL